MSDGNNGSGKRPHDDSSEGGSAKKPRGGMTSWEKIEIRLLIPYHTAGAIIGKGGANIKELRQEFDANVQIPDSNGCERIITIITKSSENAAKVTSRILDALMERMNLRDKDGVIKLLVHKSQAGTIIGLKGARIKELRDTTGAHIRVNQECCPESTDRICQIKGAKDTVIKSLQIIIELLQEAPPKGVMHNYDPDFFDDSYDYGGYNRFDRDGGMDRGRRGGGPRGGGSRGGGRGGGPREFRRGGRFDDDFGGDGFSGRRGRGGMRGRGGGRGRGGRGFDDDRYNNRGGYRNFGNSGYDDYEGGGYDDYGGGYDDYDDSYGDGYGDDFGNHGRFDRRGGRGGGYDDMDETTTQVTIPTDLAGSIIGKGGQRIRQIRQDSGAMIRINEPEPGSDERIITIIGTESATQNAQYLLQKSVKMFSDERY